MKKTMNFLPNNLKSEHPNHFHTLIVDVVGQIFQSEFIRGIDALTNNTNPETKEEAVENISQTRKREK